MQFALLERDALRAVCWRRGFGEEQFENCFSILGDPIGMRFDLHAIGNECRTRGQLLSLAVDFHIDQAQAARSLGTVPLVEAKGGNVETGLLQRIEYSRVGATADGNAIYFDIEFSGYLSSG